MSSPIQSPELESVTSPDFDALDRGALVDSRGRAFRDFRRTLHPRYGRAWAALLAGHVVLALAVIGCLAVQGSSLAIQLPAVAFGALVIGYTVAYVGLFIHEGAHFLLASTREVNDRLTNLVVGALIGQDVKVYRPLHFDHHRFLGTPRDPEGVYFRPLDWRFIFESLTGIRLLRVLLGREQFSRRARASGRPGPGSLLNRQLLLALALHGTLLGTALLAGHMALAVAWLAGMLLIFPFFAALRPLLEHRDVDARRDVDYTRVAHGEINRIFGDGPIASTLGGAGFNRHLLHHWEPQISCTRLRDLEAYLADTPAADLLERHRTSYLRVLSRLLSSRRVAEATAAAPKRG
jgi:fatty acid desaturase